MRSRVRRAAHVATGAGVVCAAMVGIAGPAGAPTAPVAASASVAASARSGPGAPAAPVAFTRSPPTGIAVPAIGIDTGLVGLGLRADATMEVPSDAATIGWFTGAPTPGERGPAVVAAHVDWAGEPGAFARLHALGPGDEIRIRRADGRVVVFAVDRVEQHPKDRFPTDAVYGDLDTAGLRLITCGGAFDAGARSYADNVVVFASVRR